MTIPGAALWWEDGVATGKSPSADTYTAGAPLVVANPEPTAGALSGIVALGLLARRRNRR
jgi:hypothetical protein